MPKLQVLFLTIELHQRKCSLLEYQTAWWRNLLPVGLDKEMTLYSTRYEGALYV